MHIPMTPDKTVQWEKHEVPSYQGAVYLPPNLTVDRKIDLTYRLLLFSMLSPRQRDEYEKVGRDGKFGSVNKVDGFAVKTFHPQYWEYSRNGIGNYVDTHIGLSAVRANVILEEGLSRAQREGKALTFENRRVSISAQRMLGAFVSNAEGFLLDRGERPPTESRAVWAMTYEAGITGDEYTGSLPTYQDLGAYYDMAAGLCDAQEFDLAYDHHASRQNQIVRTDDEGLVAEIVKIDTTAGASFNW